MQPGACTQSVLSGCTRIKVRKKGKSELTKECVNKIEDGTSRVEKAGTSEAAWDRHRKADLKRAIATPLRSDRRPEQVGLNATMQKECKRFKEVERKNR